MTFLEKAKLEFPKMEEDKITDECPQDFNLEKESICPKRGCEECWNREMPNTEAKTKSQIALEKIEDSLVHGVDRKELFERISAYGDAIADTHYEKGLNDAWELAKKITLNTQDGGMIETVSKVFGKYAYDVFAEMTPQEALAKLKAYEEAQKKIEIGDVIVSTLYPDMNCGVAVKIMDNRVNLVHEDGSFSALVPLEFMVKTGKHIDIKSILEQIGE